MKSATPPRSPSLSVPVVCSETQRKIPSVAVAEFCGVFDFRCGSSSLSAMASATIRHPNGATDNNAPSSKAMARQRHEEHPDASQSRWLPPSAMYKQSINAAAPPSPLHQHFENPPAHAAMTVSISDLNAAWSKLPPVGSAGRPVRIVCVSDTHLLEQHLTLPLGDILIHAGDFLQVDSLNTETVSLGCVKKVFDWFRSQPHAHKFFIGGNHDRMLAEMYKRNELAEVARPAVFLEAEKVHSACGVTLRGCSWSFTTGSINDAFQGDDEIAKLALPTAQRCDILVTHSELPSLRLPLLVNIDPQLHICGHWHSRHGVNRGIVARRNKTIPDSAPDAFFVNEIPNINVCSVANDRGAVEELFPPTVIDVVPRSD